MSEIPPPYQFRPEGLRVFVIDHDTTQLHAIADMCSQCNYQLITSTTASFALHLLRQTTNSPPPCFDLILIEAQMPDMDSYHFLQLVTQEIKIPVIMMMSVDHHDTTTTTARMKKAIQNGASDYWLKPLNLNHLNNMCQHVAPTIQQQQQQHDHQIPRKQLMKKRETKKNRVSWRNSPKLDEQFLKVVNQLGIHKATPKLITKFMAVPGLTEAQVASHLQKFRLRLKTKSNSKQQDDQYHHVPDESLQVLGVPFAESAVTTTNSSVLNDQNLHASVYGSMSMPSQTEFALSPDPVYSCQTGFISSPDAVRSCETGLIANSCQMGSMLPSPDPADNQAVNDDILSMLDIFNDSEENIAAEGALLGDFFEGLEDLECSALGSFGQNAEFSTNGMTAMGDVGRGDLDFHFLELPDLDSEMFWQSTTP